MIARALSRLLDGIAAAICAIRGHNLWYFEGDIVGLVVHCGRCGAIFSPDPAELAAGNDLNATGDTTNA